MLLVVSEMVVENFQSVDGASRVPRRFATQHWLDQRGPSQLFRLRVLIWLCFGALLIASAVVVSRDPTDLVALALLVATGVLGGALMARHALDQQLVRRQSDRQAGEAQILQGLSRSVSADAIVDAIVNALRRSADADHVVVARLRPVERVVETMLVSTRAMIPPSRSVLPASVLETDAGRKRQRRHALLVGTSDSTAKAVAAAIASRLAETYALPFTLAAPLVTGSHVVGTLVLSRRLERQWSAADRRLLAFSADELSAALARAFAFEEVETRANIDALTGLPNRRYLQEALASVGPRRRAGDRIGALMIDLDHFKRLNDRYGHATGDRILRHVGEKIAVAVRADDTPARYGGEEFAVLLRRADPQQAVEVAERIRAHIGDMPLRELGIGEPLTVSIGVAVAESHATDPTALLQSADEALYLAKRDGRDRVVLATAAEQS